VKSSDAQRSLASDGNARQSSITGPSERAVSHSCSNVIVAGTPETTPGGVSVRRLFAGHRYFGLEAQALRNGAERALARISRRAPGSASIDIQSLHEDFRLERPASRALLAALLSGGLLHSEGNGRYRPTDLFREYALSSVIYPLSRSRAKALIGRTCELASRVNEDWHRNPFWIKILAVSGGYMSRIRTLEELSLWLVLRRRSETSARRWRPQLSKGDGLRQILTAVNGVSSFIVVRVVADKQAVQRPFSVVFQANEDASGTAGPSWEWLRDWSSSLSRRFASR
jgi:hypothetical protein